jgi:Ca2+-binding RTX toxin-like protein
MALTAAEQYLIELINRARLDPQAEAARYGLSLNAGLNGNVISGAPLDVLAPNTDLENAAENHSNWMLDVDTFSHTGVNGSGPGERISDAGYQFTGSWAWRENLAWTGTTAQLDTAEAVEEHHEGLYRSSGHRVNTFSANIQEIGVAQVTGRFTHQGTTYNSSMLTLNFAASGQQVFVTGVTYQDRDDDAFYDIGEGYGGIEIATDQESATAASAGGYGVKATADRDLAVTVSQDSTILARLTVDTSDGNAKLDVVEDADGDYYLAVSKSAVLVSGITDAQLLGIADLDLSGNSDHNRLTGNSGSNALYGHNGNDHLFGGAGADALFGGNGHDVLKGGKGRDTTWGSRSSTNADELDGGAGNDRLFGQSGADTLDGGAGNDRLKGGGGRDTFVFNDGQDRVLDFADDVDTITLDASTLGMDMTVAEVVAMGRVVDGDTVFDFGDGNVLTLDGWTDIAALQNDLEII